MVVKVASAQLNQIVGDLEGNVARIERAVIDAAAAGADVLLTPELGLCGYPPEDLLFRNSFHAAIERQIERLRDISRAHPSMTIVVGFPLRRAGRTYNAAGVMRDGAMIGEYHKRELPNYAVFDERRYFSPGDRPLVLDIKGVRFGIIICEDFWFPSAGALARAARAQVLLALSASPYHINKRSNRLDIVRVNVCSKGLGIIAANMAGSQDELVFDGQSFALNPDGRLAAQAAEFREDLMIVEVDDNAQMRGQVTPELPMLAQVWEALKLGLRDYVEKNRFPGVLLGLSGGIDSALVCAIAVDALGAERVQAVMMPSRYTSEMSLEDARAVATALGVQYRVMPIEDCVESFRTTLADAFLGRQEDATEENLQARIRGSLLMALSNKFGSVVITTGNKSELAVGYATLYGDMAGGFAVIKDIAKTLVYRLAEYRNSIAPVIPQRVLTRAPTAELRENQTDQDSLPSYEILDEILQMYMEQDLSTDQIVAAGLPRAVVQQVVRQIAMNEYKRRQAPIGIRVTDRAFGRDWRYPITSYYRV